MKIKKAPRKNFPEGHRELLQESMRAFAVRMGYAVPPEEEDPWEQYRPSPPPQANHKSPFGPF